MESNRSQQECGPSFCPISIFRTEIALSYDITRQTDLSILSTVNLISIVIASILIAVNVDSLVRYGELKRPNAIHRWKVKKLLEESFRHLRRKKCMLLMPISIWTGFQNAFFVASFTQAYIKCLYGLHRIGYAMIAYGVMGSLFSMSTSYITNIIGRTALITFGAGLNLGMMATMLFSTLENPSYIYVIAAVWGAANSIWQTQVHAIHGSTFENTEIAFCCFRLYDAIGGAVAYSISSVACAKVEISSLAGLLGIALIVYYIFEYQEKKLINTTNNQTTNSSFGNQPRATYSTADDRTGAVNSSGPESAASTTETNAYPHAQLNAIKMEEWPI